jgi:hypothetical protein
MKTEAKYYIEYLNKDKGHVIDIVFFRTYEEAIRWAKKNLENFNIDIIQSI